jgi:hypothetical protein
MQFSAAAAFTFFAALAAAASVEVSDVEVTKYVYTINGEIPAWKPKHVSLTLNGHQANNIFCEANIVAYPTDILKCADGSSYRFTLKQGGQFTGQEFGIGLYFDRYVFPPFHHWILSSSLITAC